jgi:hypothetical protein
MPEGGSALCIVFIDEIRSPLALENGIPNLAFLIRTDFRAMAGST